MSSAENHRLKPHRFRSAEAMIKAEEDSAHVNLSDIVIPDDARRAALEGFSPADDTTNFNRHYLLTLEHSIMNH